MKANELRIGNIIQSYKGIETVVDILCDSVNTLQGGGLYNDYDGIELTEEWLIKMGFTGDSYANFMKFIDIENWVMVSFVDYSHTKLSGVDVSDLNLSHIKHVHQLQNLWHCLTGEELTMN